MLARTLRTALLLGLAVTIPARARSSVGCNQGSIRVVWPPESVAIPSNPWIVLEPCAIEDLASHGPVLVSGEDQIELLDANAGLHRGIALVAAQPLRPGGRYRISFVGLLGARPPEHEGWEILDALDLEPPTWGSPPRVSDQESMHEDDRISVAVEFATLEGGGSVAMIAEREREDGEGDPARRRFLLTLESPAPGRSRARIPCALCETGEVYGFRLALVDLAGNRSAIERIRVRVPLPRPVLPGTRVVTTLDPPMIVERLVEPTYPPIAQRARVQDTVEGSIVVDAAGVVADVEIRGRHHFGLDEATIEALLQWKFPPAETPTRHYAFTTRFLLLAEVYTPKWSVEQP